MVFTEYPAGLQLMLSAFVFYLFFYVHTNLPEPEKLSLQVRELENGFRTLEFEHFPIV